VLAVTEEDDGFEGTLPSKVEAGGAESVDCCAEMADDEPCLTAATVA